MRVSVDELVAGGPQLSVGLLSADLLRLGEELAVLEHEKIKLVHVDVMTGCSARR